MIFNFISSINKIQSSPSEYILKLCINYTKKTHETISLSKKDLKSVNLSFNGMLCKWNSNMCWCCLRQQKHSIFTCDKLKFVTLIIRVQTPYLTILKQQN